MREIPLTQGLVALVDDEDYEVLNAYKWQAQRHGHTAYAVRHASGQHSVQERMHRIVLARMLGRPLANDEMSDHINGNGLDNRRENLRPSTCAQNQRNCRKPDNAQTGRYLGVRWVKHCKSWQAGIGVNRKDIYLGIYSTETEAALAREFYIAAHPELHARSNFSQRELTL